MASPVRAACALALIVAGVPLASEARVRCTGGRYLVQRSASPIIAASGVELVHDALVVGPGDAQLLSLGDGCPATAVRFTQKKTLTLVRARWIGCPGIAGRVRLRARLDRTCERMKGVVVARRLNIRKPFTATLSRCGDNIENTF